MKPLRFNWMVTKRKTSTRKERYEKRPKNTNVEYYLDEDNQIKRR